MKDKHVLEARARLTTWLRETLGEGAEILRFEEALTHPSYANEVRAADNQRLEFLGDAVLGLCVSEILSTTYPEANEGELTLTRSALVNAEALADWARSISLGACVALGRGADAGGERDQTNVLGDAVEALIAAVYEARGLEGARTLVREIIRTALEAREKLGNRDPKSALQEYVQAHGEPTPSYRVTESRGPRHEPIFAVEVVVGERVLGKGEGRSKRLAERAAATEALNALAATPISSEAEQER